MAREARCAGSGAGASPGPCRTGCRMGALDAAARARRARGRAAAAVALGGLPAAAARAGGARHRRASSCAPTTRRACCGPAASPIPTSCGCAAGRWTARRTRWRSRARCDEVRAVLGLRAGVAVVPFGGGTSVVGGVDAVARRAPGGRLAGPWGLDRLLSVDARSRVAVFEPGIQLPAAEGALNAQGFTLGHFPQSYEYATVGGCVATRSAGQASHGLRAHRRAGRRARSCVTPAGDVKLLTVPASAAGPDLRELLVGSEGALGVLTRVALRIRPLAGRAPLRGLHVRLVRAGLRGVPRARAGGRRAARRAAERRGRDRGDLRDGRARGRRRRIWRARYLRARRVERGCLAIFGWEGDAGRRRGRARGIRRGAAPARRGRPRPLPGPRLVSAAASTARTCATTCWSAA